MTINDEVNFKASVTCFGRGNCYEIPLLNQIENSLLLRSKRFGTHRTNPPVNCHAWPSGLERKATMSVYLALGDSMSIDDYTGIQGGGAVNQFYEFLGGNWSIDDLTVDGYCIPDVQTDGHGEIITLTIGGNDLLCNMEQYLSEGLDGFAEEHLELLTSIRAANPNALIMVGDIYQPDTKMTDAEAEALSDANGIIHQNCQQAGVYVVPIHDTFQGNETTFLCQEIEPTLEGAKAIAELFEQIYEDVMH